MMGEKIVLGLSGGVDSSAAALVLREAGYEVHGVWLDLGFGSPERARVTAAQLGIAFSVFSAAETHERLVRAPFEEAYRNCLTPNPCVVCNPTVKLPSLLKAADAIGAARIATGHYAAVEMKNGRPCLRRSGGDKDQSYMLALVGPELLARLTLPLSAYTKPQVRELDARAGLATADAPDSQDICFIPDGDYGAWLEARGGALPPGEMVDGNGKVLGRHRGLHRYTVGQRRGLGVPTGERLYVCALRPGDNTLLLGPEAALVRDRITVQDVHWGALPGAEALFRCGVKTRSRPTVYQSEVIPSEGGLTICFDSPIRRPAPGQLAVGYDDEGFVLFAGTIAEETP